MHPEGPLFHKPKSIIAAKNILYATVFLGIMNWAISQWTTDLHKNASGQAIITLIVSAGVILALIRQVGLGKKWARVVLLILFIAGVLVYPWTLPALLKANMLVAVLSLFLAALQILALVFLFSRDSTQWFNRVHAAVQDEPPKDRH